MLYETMSSYLQRISVIFKFNKTSKMIHPSSSLVASFDNIRQFYHHNENDMRTQCYGNGLLVKYINKKAHVHQVTISIASKSRSF